MSKPETSPSYLRSADAAKFLSIGCSTLEKLRCVGGGPRFSKLGRVVVYSIPDLQAWAESRAVNSTSEADQLSNRIG
ncbi:MAG: DNA-binding protein [Nitrospirae bacterium]|nr:DNA-binding protein [Magnetococcales bacterium]HAT50869.1 DNA-binding protein [Alphaproteobacteria bacterium]